MAELYFWLKNINIYGQGLSIEYPKNINFFFPPWKHLAWEY